MPKPKADIMDILNKASEITDPSALDSSIQSDLKTASDLAKEKLSTPTRVDNEKDFKDVLDALTPRTEARKAPSFSAVNETEPVAKDGFTTPNIGVNPYHPDINVTAPASSAAQNTAANAKAARPATTLDLANLTESDILSIPQIEAFSFDIPAMLQLKPKDGAIRFRWVNFKNYEGGNYAMFKAIGFVNAHPDDVADTVSEHLLKEDGTVKWFDVILMKIPTLRLMGSYKKNMIRSLEMVGRWQKSAINQAKRSIENEIGSDIWNQLRERGLRVEIYAPTVSEMFGSRC